MKLAPAREIAQNILLQLQPHCHRIDIAGSIRRGNKPEVKDIEIVCIPKPYQVGLFADGIAQVVEQWPKIKGELPCRYTQRMLPQGIKLDLFMCSHENWGQTMAIRTGPAGYSHKVLGQAWTNRGYTSKNGILHDAKNRPVASPTEQDFYRVLGIRYAEPHQRHDSDEKPQKATIT